MYMISLAVIRSDSVDIQSAIVFWPAATKPIIDSNLSQPCHKIYGLYKNIIEKLYMNIHSFRLFL